MCPHTRNGVTRRYTGMFYLATIPFPTFLLLKLVAKIKRRQLYNNMKRSRSTFSSFQVKFGKLGEKFLSDKFTLGGYEAGGADRSIEVSHLKSFDSDGTF